MFILSLSRFACVYGVIYFYLYFRYSSSPSCPCRAWSKIFRLCLLAPRVGGMCGGRRSRGFNTVRAHEAMKFAIKISAFHGAGKLGATKKKFKVTIWAFASSLWSGNPFLCLLSQPTESRNKSSLSWLVNSINNIDILLLCLRGWFLRRSDLMNAFLPRLPTNILRAH